MPAPEVLIDVEAGTGIWRTDGVPMVYTPRMFLVNMQRMMEEALGHDEFRRVIYASSETSAMQWCRDQAATQGLSPGETFRHYLRRLSQRGFGQVTIEALDVAAGTGTILVRNSAFALGYGAGTGRCVCHMFEGSFGGGMRYLMEAHGSTGAPWCEEVECLAAGAAACRFELQPARVEPGAPLR
jgi:predicted hydrocarbon binding protein